MSEHPPRVIRETLAADVPAITRLAGELGYASTEKQMKRRFERVVADREHRIFVAQDSAGRVIGWVQVHYTRWLASDPNGEVVGLIVALTERGRGVGRQLMNAAETWTKSQGGEHITLRSNIVRKGTHVFYERLGYKVTKTSLNFRKTL